MTREQKINTIGTIILTGFFVSVIFHYVNAAYMGLSYPHNTFLFTPVDRFNDFFHPYNLSANLNPYFEKYIFPSNYFPFGNLVFYVFTFFPKWLAFLIYSSIFIVGFLIINHYYVGNKANNDYRNTIIFSCLAFPFLFTVDRGNLEGLMCISLLLFMFYFIKKNIWLSSLFLAVPICMKLYPAVFLMLFLSEKRYKEFMLTSLLCLLLTVISLFLFEGGFIANLKFVLSGFGISGNYNLANNNVMQSGVGLFSMVKALLISTGAIETVNMATINRIYVLSVMVTFCGMLAFIFLARVELWKKAALLTFAMLLFPQISGEYKLLHLYVPMFLFINNKHSSKSDMVYSVIFGLLLIPKNYYIFPSIVSDSGTADISIRVVLNPLLMVSMMGSIIFSGLLQKREYRTAELEPL